MDRATGEIVRHSYLIQFLRERLGEDDREALRALFSDPVDTSPESYDAVIARTRARLPALRSEVEESRNRIERRSREIVDAPEERRLTILESSPPSMLLALARDLIARSYAARFDSSSDSLRWAEQGLVCAERLAGDGYPTEEASADLMAEAQIHLANALRLEGDLKGSDRAFEQAASWLERGGGDRELRADYLKLLAALRFAQAQCDEAGELWDREIRLRRLLDDPAALGGALLNRGILAAWSGELDEALDYLERGVRRVDNPGFAALALHALAERLARDGRGIDAWMVVSAAQSLAPLVEGDRYETHLAWVRGITYRALGAHDRAAPELAAVRDAFLQSGNAYRAALVSLDLAAVAAAQGDVREVKRHAEASYAEFRRQGLERRALAAFMILYRAASAETLTEELAVRVANFVTRRPMLPTERAEELGR